MLTVAKSGLSSMSSLSAGDSLESGIPFDSQAKEDIGGLSCTGDYSGQVSNFPEQKVMKRKK